MKGFEPALMDKQLMTIDAFFEGQDEAKQIFDVVLAAAEGYGPVETRVSISQVALVHGKPFAWLWIPGKYLKRNLAPLVLTFSFRYRDSSKRWKQVVEPYPGRFTHHLELYSPGDVDDQVREWLRLAISYTE
jgi:hypothetical protein